MLVDDNPAHLMTGKNMLRKHFEVFDLPSPEKLFEFLEFVVPDIILLDVDMPSMSGYEVIAKLKEDERLADVPIMFVTARREAGNELKGLSLGAVDYVAKPFSAPRLIKRIRPPLALSGTDHRLDTGLVPPPASVAPLDDYCRLFARRAIDGLRLRNRRYEG
jgi:putative two-component system response regulator